MIDHLAQWIAPSPLWGQLTNVADPGVRLRLGRPAILRFATDSFMSDFLGLMDRDPLQMSSLIAAPETWRGPLSASASLDPEVPTSGLARKLARLRLIADRKRNGTGSDTKTSMQSSSMSTPQPVLKLYQPAHQRYYLVASSLVCNIAGFPNRTIDPGRSERASFVVRRLIHPDASKSPAVDPDGSDEFAYVSVPGGFRWKKITGVTGQSPKLLIPGEEATPLFAVTFSDDQALKRRILAGLIPVGKREAYMAAGIVPASSASSSASMPLPKTARKIHFRMLVAEPWKRLIERAFATTQLLTAPEQPIPLGADAPLIRSAREQIQTGSWLLLVDFSKYLEQYLPDAWKVIVDPLKGTGDLSTQSEVNLFVALKNSVAGPALTASLMNDGSLRAGYTMQDVAPSLLDALRWLNDPSKHWIDNLENTTTPYGRGNPDPAWPPFLFPLADPLEQGPSIPDAIPPLGTADGVDAEPALEEAPQPDLRTQIQKESQAAQNNIDKLVALVVRAMPTDAHGSVPAIPVAAQPVMDTREGWFAIRCVFESPECGPLDPPIVSERTPVFQMAGFFDPDAPARPIRIALPIDTSPAGLRKFDKNTAFMISDVLCGQINRVKGLSLGDLIRSVLPWPLHKDLSVPEQGPCVDTGGMQAGMICSMSIPIITICALILLMIIVNLLDIIFRWVPFFIMCFPLPGFKAKKT